MRRGRGWLACFGLGTLLTMFAAVGVSTALAVPASLKWDPPAYDFGQVPYGSGLSEPHEFILTNTGGTQLVIKHWRSGWLAYWPEVPDPFGVTSSDCHTLEPGESCLVEMAFDPLHPGIWKGWQKVSSQVEGEPWAEVQLTGEGSGPWVPMRPERLLFGSVPVGTTTVAQTITVESQDREEFEIEEIFLTPTSVWSPTPFQVVGGSCHEGGSLTPGETCTIQVAMAPTEAGVFRSELEIADGAPGSPQSVELEGAAPAPAEEAQPLSQPTILTPPKPVRRVCPKGKRKVVKKGRRTCVKKHRHRRHHAGRQ
jgi:hypothetical protein